MAIRYFSEDITLKISNKRILKNWIQNLVKRKGFEVGDINFIYTSDKNILEINTKYLNHKYFTDIITFNYNTGSIISGDIYISIETVSTNAGLYNTTFLDELHRVMVHGILHLIGLNDGTQEEKEVMRKAEDNALLELYTKFLPNK